MLFGTLRIAKRWIFLKPENDEARVTCYEI